jgi:DNA (cytosine-5)-methyltransferase 1
MGFEAAGMTVAWQCELDAWKRSVLAAHYPSIPIYDDITTLFDPEPVDLMVGGFPCQDLSIAGKRKGFTGERSVLAFEFLRLAETLKPRWLVLENVPGLLSSNKGLDFQRLLREVAACGYGVGYRCLDARYFGVPQRRRRIFVVARRVETGVDPRAASGFALQSLCESGGGDTTPCVPPWQGATQTVDDGIGISGSFRSTASFGQWVEDENAGTLARRDYKSPNRLVTGDDMIAYRKSARVNADPDSPETWVDDGRANTLNRFDVGDVRTTHAVVDVVSTLQAQHGRGFAVNAEMAAGGQLITETFSVYPEGGNGADIAAAKVDRSPSLTKVRSERGIHVTEQASVRRLSPTETEALMGWPRNWTAPEGVKAPDSRRYAACGDGIVANVAYWIGQRIMQIDKETQ